MEKYLSHFSALAVWNIPYTDIVLGTLIDTDKRTEFTYSCADARIYKEGQKTYSCQIELPAGAVRSINGIRVASPELIFIQLASKLDIHRLILLGLQLCSHLPGKVSEAITTKQKLKNFTEKAHGHIGRPKAMRALKYIEGGSASIMESIAYMILTLPHTLGGYGLAAPVFNHEIRLKDGPGKRLGQNRCFVDLYYKSAKVAVEYDSFTFHNSPSEQGKDALRSAILERHGIEVMSLSTIQLYDREACKDFAHNLAGRIGKRIQIRTKKFNLMSTELRKLLPLKNVDVKS